MRLGSVESRASDDDDDEEEDDSESGDEDDDDFDDMSVRESSSLSIQLEAA